MHTHFCSLLPNIKARDLLKVVQHLNNPVVFYQGHRSLPAQNSPHHAVLAYDPQHQKGGKLDYLDGLISDDKASTLKQASHFIAGWALCLPYSCGSDFYLNQESDYAYAHYYDKSFYLNLDDDTVHLQAHHAINHRDVLKIANCLIEEINSHSQYSTIKPTWQPVWSKQQYIQAFEHVKNYLRSGDVYQVNLAYPFYCNQDITEQSPLALFEYFQAPFCGYFHTTYQQKKRVLFSVSPERLIRVKDRQVEARPIKGTMPRGETPEQDEKLKQALQQCAKNRAENLMIVDLLRNDLSRTAKLHSVKVNPMFAVESYQNVHHLVSSVKSELEYGANITQLILDVFPGGSITGAPKKRAIEIIQELEARPRGFYCGSLGYIDDAGHSDFNILIRSIEASSDGAYCWGGGGIVMDSQALDEYQEIEHKVRSLINLAF